MKLDSHKIKCIMARQRLSVKALAERMGTQANNLSSTITRGTCRPETAARIAFALDVDVQEIIKEA